MRPLACLILLTALSLAILIPAYAQDETNFCTLTSTVETGVVQERTLLFDGVERQYLLYVPESINFSQAVPLMLSFHGFASKPSRQVITSKWDDVAEDHQFIVAYPKGTDTPTRWNAGDHFFASAQPADDVGFASTLIATLEDEFCIDSTRVYATGVSNGGGMSNRLACELSDQITAIGTVAGVYSPLKDGCNPSRPVPVIAFHGTADPIVPYSGGLDGGMIFPDVSTWAEEWAVRNGCSVEPELISSVGDVSGVHYTNCEEDADVVFYTIQGGGHTWPGGGPQGTLISGKLSMDIDASEVIWSFMSQYTLP